MLFKKWYEQTFNLHSLSWSIFPTFLKKKKTKDFEIFCFLKDNYLLKI